MNMLYRWVSYQNFFMTISLAAPVVAMNLDERQSIYPNIAPLILSLPLSLQQFDVYGLSHRVKFTMNASAHGVGAIGRYGEERKPRI
ncbi:uncharacterized protein F5891DRAFT_94808 [Suillus fuscotomentosus]|uniref:Uncharacterized protein n=1 Tax=Suillus fuscotomentosus TaxID=1912939 RepID=A0AAD4HMN5_9AGAM|nr:uncharacterized protein F5891DRAFT_94808 [Suillus fuscotomentosus]KAG1903285.1 hypothetical protein F5891DRAFT_94808 [Suillus fuscotomentosus]